MQSQSRTTLKPFPWRQMIVIALCRICEPIAFMSIFPYAYKMVTDFNLSDNEKANAMYAGMLTSSFAIAEFATSIFWGRLSDKIGRKPVLLGGLAGTGLSMTLLGFSTNLTTALLARALGGLLNGNIGVINTTVGELITEKTHMDTAFGIIPGVWCVGSVVGSAIGGLLADAVKSYPSLFSTSTLLSRFPYLLPNMACTIMVLLSLSVGILFLEETHQDRKDDSDYGLLLGNRLLAIFGLGRRHDNYNKLPMVEKSFDEESVRSSMSVESTEPNTVDDLLNTKLEDAIGSLGADSRETNGRPGRWTNGMFTSQVVIIILSCGILAYHTISTEQLLPIILSLPRDEPSTELPFYFTSGFALSTKVIGTILSAQGIVQALATFLAFPWLSARLGSLRVYQATALSYPLLYILLPYIAILPAFVRPAILCVAIVWKVTAQAFSFPPLSIALTNSAPRTNVLGTLFGTYAAAASLSRAVGPTISGMLQGSGLAAGILGLPWWTNSAIAVVGLVLAMNIRKQGGS